VGVDRWDIRGRTEPEAFGSFIHHDADATDLGFAPSGSYELFIVQHVIEEVPDYPSALDEAARLLEPGGRALLEIPFDETQPDTVHHPPNRYANVWAFGRDLRDQLNARFDQVQEVELSEGLYRAPVFVCRRAP
jgi:ubiquinone/menaquinone biosynthesis C-methylase UbiE